MWACVCLSGCTENPDSKPSEESNKPLFPYPKTVAELKANKDFSLYYKGEKSGIEYYIQKVPNEVMDKYPYSDPVYKYIIVGPKIARVYVPVKNNQIVEIDLGDTIVMGMKIAEEDQGKK
jgi:hypothetical protein